MGAIRGRVLSHVRLLGLVMLAAAMASGCDAAPSEEPSVAVATGPLLVSGEVVNGQGQLVPDSTIQVQVWDTANLEVGQAVKYVYEQSVGADANGRFEIHLTPPPNLVVFARSNGDFVNFHLMWFDPSGRPGGVWGFPRRIVGDGWQGDAPRVRLTPTVGVEIP